LDDRVEVRERERDGPVVESAALVAHGVERVLEGARRGGRRTVGGAAVVAKEGAGLMIAAAVFGCERFKARCRRILHADADAAELSAGRV